MGEGNESIWVWEFGLGNSPVHGVAYLGPQDLYIRQNIIARGSVDKVLEAIRQGQDPREVFTKKKEIAPLQGITAFRIADGNGVLEIDQNSGGTVAVYARDSETCPALFNALRQRLAPDAQPKPATISGFNSITTPVFGLFITLLAGIGLVLFAFYADPNPQNVGRRAGLENTLEVFVAKIGVLGAVGVVLAATVPFLAWIILRLKFPTKAQEIAVNTASS